MSKHRLLNIKKHTQTNILLKADATLPLFCLASFQLVSENIKLICHDQVLVQLILNSLRVNGIHITLMLSAPSTLAMADMDSIKIVLGIILTDNFEG